MFPNHVVQGLFAPYVLDELGAIASKLRLFCPVCVHRRQLC